MNLPLLRVLTWGTVAAAVVSALLLASGESGLPDWSHRAIGDAVVKGELPTEPASGAEAGLPPVPGPAASAQRPAPSRQPAPH